MQNSETRKYPFTRSRQLSQQSNEQYQKHEQNSELWNNYQENFILASKLGHSQRSPRIFKTPLFHKQSIKFRFPDIQEYYVDIKNVKFAQSRDQLMLNPNGNNANSAQNINGNNQKTNSFVQDKLVPQKDKNDDLSMRRELSKPNPVNTSNINSSSIPNNLQSKLSINKNNVHAQNSSHQNFQFKGENRANFRENVLIPNKHQNQTHYNPISTTKSKLKNNSINNTQSGTFIARNSLNQQKTMPRSFNSNFQMYANNFMQDNSANQKQSLNQSNKIPSTSAINKSTSKISLNQNKQSKAKHQNDNLETQNSCPTPSFNLQFVSQQSHSNQSNKIVSQNQKLFQRHLIIPLGIIIIGVILLLGIKFLGQEPQQSQL